MCMTLNHHASRRGSMLLTTVLLFTLSFLSILLSVCLRCLCLCLFVFSYLSFWYYSYLQRV